MMNTLDIEPGNLVIITLGNPDRGDDGVGTEIAHGLRQFVSGCHIVTGVEDSLSLLSAWENFAVAIVLDAAVSGSTPGTIHRIETQHETIPRDLGRYSSHGMGLAEAVELAKTLGRLPQRLIIYAVEAASFRPGVKLSAEVAVSARQVVERLSLEVAQITKGRTCTKPL